MTGRFLRTSLMGALLTISAATAQETRPATQPNAVERLRQYVELQRQMLEQFKNKDYAAGEQTCRRMVEIAPNAPDSHYNLACAIALGGKKDAALDELARTVELGYGDTAHMKEDTDLASIRDDKRFDELIKKAQANEAAIAEKRYEKGDEIAGVKTVEGSPESGLRYRLRMSPNAAKAKPNKLVIWLHPSGGSMNKQAEAMAPLFIKQGYALLVFTAKNWAGWSETDAMAIARRTLPEVGRIEGIDASRPILFGYSAGGQLALTLWLRDPAAYGALILDAAYPIQLQVTGNQGTMKLLAPPKGDAAKACPLFVLVGDKDRLMPVWMQAEQPYRAAGVPLTIHYVAGQGHTWLFGGAQRDKLSRWLGELAAGKIPGTQPDETPATQPVGPVKPPKPEEIF